MIAINNFYNLFMKEKKYKSITKFGCVGCLNTLVYFGMFSILNSFFGVNYIISQIISYSSGILNSYVFNKFWTFNDTKSNKRTTKEFTQFIIVNIASLSASLLGLSILMKDNSINAFIAKIFSMFFAQVVNFLGYRFWVFCEGVQTGHNTKRIA